MAEHIPVEVVSVEEVVQSQAEAPAQIFQTLTQTQPPLNTMLAGSSTQSSEIASLMQSQLQIMQMQLQALSGSQVAQSAAAPLTSVAPTQVNSTQDPSAGKPSDQKENCPDSDIQLSSVTKNAMRMPRISRETIGMNLTVAQQKWVDELMQTFQEKFAKSKEITQEHRKYFSDPRSVSGFNPAWKEIVFPMVIEKSKGSKIWDVSGNEFIDIVNGFGPILFGHRPGFIMDAVKSQFESGIETGPQHPLAGEVAKLVCEMTQNERCAYANTGSEAMACALRMVRTATGKDTVIMFEGSYHGIFDEMVARPGANYKGMPLAPGIPRSAMENVRVLPWGDPDSIDVIRSMEDVGAVIVETVQSRNPIIQDADYIKQIRAAADEIDACLIFDEVVTGFRVAAGGIQERFGVRADMVTYGKILGGGFPIGLVAGKAKYLDALDGGYWEFGNDSIPEAGVTFFAGTFLRHPAALAAAKEVLLKIKSEGPQMYQALDAKTEKLSTQVNTVIKRLECGITLDHFSSMFYVKVPSNAHWGHLLYKLMLLEGVHIIQHAGSFLTTEHTVEDIDRLIAAFTKSISLLVSNGLIEGNSVEANKVLNSQKRQIPVGARLGKNAQGEPAYFIEDPENKGQYIEVGAP
jgi:glutamate-1-semialdehyde aminotransferase